LVYEDIDSITEEIKKTWSLPVIIKRNAGSFGNNIFLCHDIEEVRLSLKQIFNINSKDYDDIALTQEYNILILPMNIELLFLIMNCFYCMKKVKLRLNLSATYLPFTGREQKLYI
jgi:hypothetical protein